MTDNDGTAQDVPLQSPVSWRELCESVNPDCRFEDGATEASITALETEFGVNLPRDLRSLLLESDGIGDAYGSGVCPVNRIRKINQEMRGTEDFADLYEPFDAMLFFGELGNGDMVFFPVQPDGQIESDAVHIWDHETDERLPYADSLRAFVERWYALEVEDLEDWEYDEEAETEASPASARDFDAQPTRPSGGFRQWLSGILAKVTGKQ